MPKTIVQLIAELRALLARASTEMVVGYVASLQKIGDYRTLTKGLGLSSPMRELYYAMGLTLTTNEPRQDDFASIQHQLAPLLERIQEEYMLPFLAPGKGRRYIESQVGFTAFARSFFSGRFIGIPQLRHRITLMLAPFDSVLLEAWGFGTVEALRIADELQRLLQQVADRLNSLLAQRGSAIMTQAGRDDLNEKIARARREFVLWPADIPRASTINIIGGAIEDFLDVFSVQRGDLQNPFTYLDDQNPFERCPIVKLSPERIAIPVVNQLYFAIVDRGIEVVTSSGSANDYFNSRGVALELQALVHLRKLLPDATFYAPVYERPGTNEHDILILFRDAVIVVECKSAPPGKAMRDPAKAFIRLRDQFNSSRGVQHGFSQATTLLTMVRQAQEPFDLYDESRRRVTIDPSVFRRFFSIVVTLDEFGVLGTDVTMLLEAKTSEWPWVISLPDLESFANMFVEVRKWNGDVFLDWLDERRDRMGDFITDDELEIAGVFLRYGTLSVYPRDAKIVGLREEAQMFDDLDRARFLGESFTLPDDPEPPAKVEIPQDLKDEVAARHRSAEKKFVGPNDKCPCGSGQKYKRCHGKY